MFKAGAWKMAQLMPLSLASVKSRLVLPLWYRLTRAVPGKRPLNGCVCVCVEAARLITLHCSLSRVLMTTDQKPQALVVLKHLYNFLKRTTYDFIR